MVNKDSFVNCIRYVIVIRQKSVAQAGLTVRKEEVEMSTGNLWAKFLRSVKFGCGNEYQNINIQTGPLKMEC